MFAPHMRHEDEDAVDEGDRSRRRVDELLPLLLAPMRQKATGRRLARLVEAEVALRRCLEAHADRLLTSPELEFLAFETAIEPEEAVARTASVDVLLLVLPIFLREERWFGVDAEDRRLRIRLADSIAHTIPRLPELAGCSCGAEVWSVEYAVDDARRDLARRRAAG